MFDRATDDSRTIGQQPVATVATRRTISCVSWSKLRPDELAIAFAFYPQIQLYDLATDCRTPKRSLLPPSIASNSGITSIAHWEHRKTTEHAEKSIVKSENSLSLKKGLPTIPNACTSRGFINESIVAGSQSGFVACWDMSNRNTSSGCAPKWVIAADPLKSYPHSSGVIGLFPLLVGRQLLTITAAGVFAVWDMVMLKVPAFGATSAPTCVWRVSLAESLSTHLVQRQLIKVSALPRNVDRCFACYSESSLHVIDLDDGCQILQSRNLAAARLQKEVPDTQFLQKQVSDESLVAECRSAAVACAVFPDCWDGEVAIVSEKEHLHFLDIKTCGRSNQLTNVATSHPNNCSPREEFTLEAIKSTEHYNCTLLAFVVSAIPGEDTIMLSHDLSRGFTVNSPAASPKEFMIMLDWTQVNFDGDLVQSNMIEQGKSCQSSQIISCQKVSSCCFLLNAPYEGPRVVLGIPRVRIRTNELQSDLSSLRRERNAPTFSGQNSRNESDPLILTQQTFQNYSPFGWWPKLCTVKNLDGRVNAEEVDLDVPIDCRHFTVLVAHPYLPYVVGGSTENSLEVLGFS